MTGAAKRVVLETLGWTLLVLGVAALFLPGPGLLGMFAGLALLSQRLRALGPRPRAALQARLQLDQQKLVGLARALAAISPLATVARGYAILRHPDGRLLRSATDASPGEVLDAQLVDGELRLRVER